MVFRIHERLLCSRVPSFVGIIAERNSGEVAQKEGLKRKAIQASKEDLNTAKAKNSDSDSDIVSDEDFSISFPNGDVVLWDMLIDWVYHNTIPALKMDNSRPVGWNWDPFAFYVLAAELEIPLLKDIIMSILQEGQAKSRMWHINERLDWTWGRTTPGCGMRRYLVLALIRNILVYKDPKEPNPKKIFTVETKEIAAVMSQHPDLLEAVVDVMRGKDGVKARDPRVVDPCEFHEHWPIKECGYSKIINGVQIQDEREINEVDLDRKLEKEKKRVVRFEEGPGNNSGDSS